jgi:hypothetical protein
VGWAEAVGDSLGTGSTAMTGPTSEAHSTIASASGIASAAAPVRGVGGDAVMTYGLCTTPVYEMVSVGS